MESQANDLAPIVSRSTDEKRINTHKEIKRVFKTFIQSFQN